MSLSAVKNLSLYDKTRLFVFQGFKASYSECKQVRGRHGDNRNGTKKRLKGVERVKDILGVIK